jgi:hypothetical protein
MDAGTKHVTVRTLHTQLLRSQHDVTILIAKERQGLLPVLVCFFVTPHRSEAGTQLIAAQVQRLQWRSFGKQRRRNGLSLHSSNLCVL